MPDPTSRLHPICFVLPKKLWPLYAKPADLDGLVRFWLNGSGPEAIHCARIVWPGSATATLNGPLQLSHVQTQLCSSKYGSDVQSQPGSDLVLADWVRFWPKDPDQS